MGWNFDKPLYSMASDEEQNEMIRQWESEKYAGLWEGNNRLPYPMTFLIALIILTAFMITMPIWGQRPNAAIFEVMVKHMNDSDVQALATPDEKMKALYAKAYAAADQRTSGALDRHPINYDDLLNIAPSIIEAQKSGVYPLDNYNVVGDKVKLANFEGNYREDGKRERIQPWWDKGYTIDVFYVSYFVLTMVLVCKRLPHFSRKPDMSKAA
jgi:hypothetical protein